MLGKRGAYIYATTNLGVAYAKVITETSTTQVEATEEFSEETGQYVHSLVCLYNHKGGNLVRLEFYDSNNNLLGSLDINQNLDAGDYKLYYDLVFPYEE